MSSGFRLANYNLGITKRRYNAIMSERRNREFNENYIYLQKIYDKSLTYQGDTKTFDSDIHNKLHIEPTKYEGRIPKINIDERSSARSGIRSSRDVELIDKNITEIITNNNM